MLKKIAKIVAEKNGKIIKHKKRKYFDKNCICFLGRIIAVGSLICKFKEIVMEFDMELYVCI